MPIERVPTGWQDLRNVEVWYVSAVVKKISGEDGVWDADARSLLKIKSPREGVGFSYYPSFVYDFPTVGGLSNQNLSAHWDTIDFCMMVEKVRPDPSIKIEIYEKGALVWSGVREYWYEQEARLLLNSGGFIQYLYSYELLYTSVIPPVFPLFADLSLSRILSWISNTAFYMFPITKTDHLPLLGAR